MEFYILGLEMEATFVAGNQKGTPCGNSHGRLEKFRACGWNRHLCVCMDTCREVRLERSSENPHGRRDARPALFTIAITCESVFMTMGSLNIFGRHGRCVHDIRYKVLYLSTF